MYGQRPSTCVLHDGRLQSCMTAERSLLTPTATNVLQAFSKSQHSNLQVCCSASAASQLLCVACSAAVNAPWLRLTSRLSWWPEGRIHGKPNMQTKMFKPSAGKPADHWHGLHTKLPASWMQHNTMPSRSCQFLWGTVTYDEPAAEHTPSIAHAPGKSSVGKHVYRNEQGCTAELLVEDQHHTTPQPSNHPAPCARRHEHLYSAYAHCNDSSALCFTTT